MGLPKTFTTSNAETKGGFIGIPQTPTILTLARYTGLELELERDPHPSSSSGSLFDPHPNSRNEYFTHSVFSLIKLLKLGLGFMGVYKASDTLAS